MSLFRFLRHCRRTQYIPESRAMHAWMISSGSHQIAQANTNLPSVNSKVNHPKDIHNLFDETPKRNLRIWNTMISGYTQKGMPREALHCFRLMVYEGFEPNARAFAVAISACAGIGDLQSGKEIHGMIYRNGKKLSVGVSNSLINMYGKCGLLRSAKLVLVEIDEPDSVSWTSMLSRYCQCGEYEEGLSIFLESRRAGIVVDEFSCSCVFSACALLNNLKFGVQMHSLVLKCGLEFDKFVLTGLIDLYAKCGELNLACRVFLEVDQPILSAWTALIGGCVQQGKGGLAIDLFLKLWSSGLKASERTFTSVIGAFADIVDIEIAKQLHALIIKMGFSSFTYVGNAILDLYSKCGLLEESLKAFEEINEHDIVSWNALISGHIRLRNYGAATQLLKNMLAEGHDPNIFTFSSILSLCADVPIFEWAKQTHCCIIKPGFDSNVVIGSSLIDAYCKCGRLSDARKIFDNLLSKNLVSWNSLILGYAQHGFGRKALEIYSMMQRNRIKPNHITFLGVISACGHVGLVDEGSCHFNSMIKDHNIAPQSDHLASMVYLFARNGHTRRAYELIKNFDMKPDKVVWRCLLSGCRAHKDLILGRYAAEKILSIDPDDTSAHVMLSSIYAEAKMWDRTAEVRKIMKQKALKKGAGYSWIELKNNIYSFSAGHYEQFRGAGLHQVLDALTAESFFAGCKPDSMLLMHFGE